MVAELLIDGAHGEGGGQILRSSLALSLLTGRSVEIERIRARRSRPGLLKQHLAALRAAAELGHARIEGDALHSDHVVFKPRAVKHGDYKFSVGTAGSATLVLHTVLWPLLQVPGRSRVVIEGGTHNPAAPPFEHLERSLVPVLRRMGAVIEVTLDRAGFYPAGGGRFVVEVEGGTSWRPLRLVERGSTARAAGRVITSALPRHIAERETAVIRRRFGLDAADVEIREPRSPGPGNAVQIEIGFERVVNVFTAFGAKGRPAENVADEVCTAAEEHLAGTAPVDEHLADQLLIPLALAGGEFRTVTPSDHTRTNVDVIGYFLPSAPAIAELDDDEFAVTC